MHNTNKTEYAVESSVPVQRIAWYLFAFAGSVLVFNGGLYFPQWLVVDNHVSDFWYNGCLILTTVLLLISAPAFGRLSDRRLGRLLFLRLTAVAMFVGTVVLFVADHFVRPHELRVVIAVVGFILTLYSYQLSLVFHNALLGKVATVRTYATVSANGVASMLSGAIIGIVVILPFVEGSLFHLPGGRGQAFLPSALLFAVLVVPSLCFMPDDLRLNPETMESLGAVYKCLWRDIVAIPRQKQLFVFLLAYLIYSDVVLTIEDNSSIYLEKVMGFADSEKAVLYLLLLVGAGLGAWLSGLLCQRVQYHRLLMCILAGWLAALGTIIFTSSPWIFYAVFFCVGMLFGALLSVSRVVYMFLLPAESRGQLFGIYTSFERSASLIGPLVWSAPIVLLTGVGRYRISMLLMAVLVGISMVVIARLGAVEHSKTASASGAVSKT
jgi:UMF1 family MFS transporter